MNSNVYTTNITITRSDFKKTSTKTIVLTRVDLEKDKNAVPSHSDEPNTNQYNFRKRNTCTTENIVSSVKRKSIEDIAPDAKRFRKDIVKKIPIPKLVVADKNVLSKHLPVIAKMRTYAAWPACIQSLQKTCVSVLFFGENSTGNVPYSGIGLIDDNYNLLRSNLSKKIVGYEKAVKQMERTLNIPSDKSLLNA